MPLDAAVKPRLADRIGLTPLSETEVLTHKAEVEAAWNTRVAQNPSLERQALLARWVAVSNRHFHTRAVPLSRLIWWDMLDWLASRVSGNTTSSMVNATLIDHTPLEGVTALAMEATERMRREGVEPVLAVEFFDTDPILYIVEGQETMGNVINPARCKNCYPIAIWDYEKNGRAKLIALAKLD
jgi:hypothetical protein